MIQVLKLADELVSTLRIKIDKADTLKSNLEESQEKVDRVADQNFIKAKDLAAVEKKYREFDDFIEKKASFKAEVADFSAKSEELKAKTASADKIVAELNKEKEALLKEKEGFSKKVLSIKAREIEVIAREKKAKVLLDKLGE